MNEQTFHRWQNQYDGIKVEEVRRLNDLEFENMRLKTQVADQELDAAIPKEAALVWKSIKYGSTNVHREECGRASALERTSSARAPRVHRA